MQFELTALLNLREAILPVLEANRSLAGQAIEGAPPDPRL